MITKTQALTVRMVFHATKRNADGTPMRARANGACKVWKTRPAEFKLPVKHGLYDYGYIDKDNAHEWYAYETDALAAGAMAWINS